MILSHKHDFYSVWKLVRSRDPFQELDLSSICFLQIFFHSYKQFFSWNKTNFSAEKVNYLFDCA